MLRAESILQGRYRIVRHLGAGGMGTVYEAVDQRLRSTVAVKQTHDHDDHLRKAFEREAQLLSALRHPALPVVTDYFVEDGGQFLVMQYIPGDDLAQMLQRAGRPFAVETVLAWADQLLDVLQYLHGRTPPILHRDIKPQNMKLTPEGQIVLLDFGLSKGVLGGMSAPIGGSSVRAYTPHFAPFEQIRGSGTDERSDLYSLAATLYCLLTTVVAPTALNRADALLSGRADLLRPVDELNPLVPASVAGVLGRALAHVPAQRPASAAEMRSALAAARIAGGAMGRTTHGAPPPQATTVDLPPPATPVTTPLLETPTMSEASRGVGATMHEMRSATTTAGAPSRRTPLLVAGLAILFVVFGGLVVAGLIVGKHLLDGRSVPPNENSKVKNDDGEPRLPPPTPPLPRPGPIAIEPGSEEAVTAALGRQGLKVTSGRARVESTAGTNLVVPEGAQYVLLFFGPGFSSPNGLHTAEVVFEEANVTSITVTRPGVRNNASTPAWQMKAFDASGAQIGNVAGEGDITNGSFLFPSSAQDFTISAPSIKSVRISSNNRLSTFSAIPFARLSLTVAAQ